MQNFQQAAKQASQFAQQASQKATEVSQAAQKAAQMAQETVAKIPGLNPESKDSPSQDAPSSGQEPNKEP